MEPLPAAASSGLQNGETVLIVWAFVGVADLAIGIVPHRNQHHGWRHSLKALMLVGG